MTTARERHEAIAAADVVCPRCSATREPDQEYCIECGLRLPNVRGTVPALRRRWLRFVGWYPGDPVWMTALMLAVAVAGAAGAIVVRHHRAGHRGPTLIATNIVASDTVPLRTATGQAMVQKKALAGRFVWPANAGGWTIVLSSYPAPAARLTALATADRAAQAGLPKVGILGSSNYPSLTPGYDVVFTGVYSSEEAADAALPAARHAGFGGAYTREVAR